MFLKNRHTAVFLLITALMFWANVGITQTKWEKYSGNPVLGLGPNGAWDDYNIWESTVLFDSAKYQMWYNGEGSPDNPRIGYATSADGMVWQKHPANPVLVPGASGAWDDWYVGYSTVLFDGAKYQM